MLKMLLGCVIAIVSFGQSNAADLAGSEWGFERADSRFIQFKEDGKVLGYGGCNRFFGLYETGTENWLKFSEMGSTRMACLESVMKQEAEFLSVLEKTASMNHKGMNLSLLDAKGNVLAAFVRKDWD